MALESAGMAVDTGAGVKGYWLPQIWPHGRHSEMFSEGQQSLRYAYISWLILHSLEREQCPGQFVMKQVVPQFPKR
jgi:hypothetical protein